MLEYGRKEIRTWSILGMRGTYGVVLNELAGSMGNLVALSADLRTTSGLDRFRANHPDRFINMGIAEQNMVGVAAGMAAGGWVPFISTFSNFLALRSCEQIRHFMGYMGENVKAVGLAAGFAMAMFGVTHYGIEDIAALRAISGLTIVSPADCTEAAKLIHAAAVFDGPVYIRLTGIMNTPIVYREDYGLQIGKAISLREGGDVAIVSTGSVVHSSLEAADLLAEQGIGCSVLDMHTIKPLDTAALDAQADKKLIVTVEEHSETGGLGSAVSEHLAARSGMPSQLVIGIAPGYPRAGGYEYLLEQAGLSAPRIAERVLRFLRRPV